jgi:hypothetical protein
LHQVSTWNVRLRMDIAIDIMMVSFNIYKSSITWILS